MAPNQFSPPGQTVPIKFGPPGQMVHKNWVPLDKWSPTNLVPVFLDPHSLSPLDKWNIIGTICPVGPNWLGTICPWGPNVWGPFVHGDKISWGPFVQRDQSIRDQLWGTKCPGTISVWDQMCHSLFQITNIGIFSNELDPQYDISKFRLIIREPEFQQ